jgi:hypothetical protein
MLRRIEDASSYSRRLFTRMFESQEEDWKPRFCLILVWGGLTGIIYVPGFISCLIVSGVCSLCFIEL